VLDAIGVMQIRRGALDAAIDSFDRARKSPPSTVSATSTWAARCRCACSSHSATIRSLQRWVGGDADRKRAARAIQTYLEIGGQYERQAREALVALGWS
jgi:hypothetical protein